MSTLLASHRNILDSQALGYLATLGPKGEPQVSAVWFLYFETRLFFALNKKQQEYLNLLRDPRVALAVTDPVNLSHSVEIRGTVVHMHGDIHTPADPHVYSNLLSQKYLLRDATPEETGPLEERVVIEVEAECVIVVPPEGKS